MESAIDKLSDDCLLCIFDLFDLIDLVPIAQVCTRWKQLTERKLNKITELRGMDPEKCRRPKKSTSLVKLKSALEYLGPQVKSVKLGDCYMKTLYLGEKIVYNISDRYNRKEFTSIVTQTCPNISELQIGQKYLKFSEQLIKTSTNLKTLKLPNNESLMFRGCTFERIEEVVLEVSEWSNVKNFDYLFPNIKKLVLFVSAQPRNIDSTIGSVLRRVKHLKSLDIYIHTEFKKTPRFGFLSHVSGLSELEELLVWKADFDDLTPKFKAGTVHQLTKKCLNLRSVSIFDISFGKTDVSIFLRLPKLEKLNLHNVKVFGFEFLLGTKPTKIENSKSLYIYFDKIDVSDFCAVIDKMPVLKCLTAYLPLKQEFEFTCELIKRQVFKKDVIFSQFPRNKSFRVSSNLDRQANSEPLVVYMGMTKADDYQNQVCKFVESLENCSVVPADGKDFEGLFDVLRKKMKTKIRILMRMSIFVLYLDCS